VTALALTFSAVALTAWVFTVVGVAYAFWRYGYLPWLVMRKDLAALNQKFEDFHAQTKQEFGLRAARALNDAEEARVEAAQRRENVWAQIGRLRA